MRPGRRSAALATIVVAAVALTAVGQPALVPRGEVTLTPTSTATPTRTPTPSSTPTPTPPPEARIGIYANAAGTDCDLTINFANPFNVFVIAKGVPGLTGADFRINNLGPTIIEVVLSRTAHPDI